MKDISILKDNNVDLDKSLELFGDMKSYEETLIDFLNSISEKLNELLKSMFSTNIKGFISINNKMTIKGSTMSLLYDIVYELIELNNNKYIMIVISKIKNNIKLKAIIDTKETLKDKIKLDKNIKIKENKYDNDTEIEFIISEVKSK